MLEKDEIGEKIFADVNRRLDEAGLMMHGGTIVDAGLIAVPKSTKNRMGYAKASYRGIEKNMNRFNVLFFSANLLMCSRAG
ncbi:MAG: hypothetical protein NC307_07730 [Roseburia sp.]|nr:hypothetical protein [Roseburia sp.]